MHNHFKKDPKDTKIVVAMSGGVDSSVVAAMMVEKGYQVIGVTMQLYDHGLTVGKKKGSCCAGQDIYDAKMVADSLNIPHYVLNYETAFKESVIDDFADSYLRGETPIPCVRCNQTVKFRDLLKMAKSLDAEALCTGHYVRKAARPHGFDLLRGVDHNKDQSYFLFATTKAQLDYTFFPLGGQSKEETRRIATKHGLLVADKPDSQDICFVPDGNYADIINKYRPGALDKGNIVHVDGRILGEHQGIINYTIGQRRGLGISSVDPLYVIKIIPDTRQVIVGPADALHKRKFIIKDVNWLGNFQTHPINASVKIRSTHDVVPARIKLLPNRTAEITLVYPEKAITPGQACVVYQEERILGGGWITNKIS
jgi:tRNA-uridine 2-sulfurtransferase